MKLSQYNYNFNPELIASHPAKYRDDARLLVLHAKTGKIEHKIFKDILEYFNDGDSMIFNDTNVYPARLYGRKEKTGANIEIFLLRELNPELAMWDVLVDPARKIRIGNKLYFGEDDSLVAEVIDNTTSRGRTLRFLYDCTDEEFRKKLHDLGEMPIPRWVRKTVEPEDAENYQTIYADKVGAVIVPSAGLHFSKHLFKRMEIHGVHSDFVTLHAGLGNYRTIDVEDLTKHKMDSEQMIITDVAANNINKARSEGKNVCAVGTTVMRAIESVVTTQGDVVPFEGWTNKYIVPPYDFMVANMMITNFHLPKSVQLIMVSAFGGYDNVMNAYQVAVDEKYRFDAYGDAMLIIK
ncbi:MAG: tRNA preQ1(34) S-adenosylmethionine ribosyltransferase-isomerase QueA [Rikenellaceae bacterium]